MDTPRPTRDRLLPYKVLSYLLYTNGKPWLSPLGERKVRLVTGDAARFFRIKTTNLWDALYWLEKSGLVTVEKEKKRGSALIQLKEVSR